MTVEGRSKMARHCCARFRALRWKQGDRRQGSNTTGEEKSIRGSVGHRQPKSLPTKSMASSKALCKWGKLPRSERTLPAPSASLTRAALLDPDSQETDRQRIWHLHTQIRTWEAQQSHPSVQCEVKQHLATSTTGTGMKALGSRLGSPLREGLKPLMLPSPFLPLNTCPKKERPNQG